MPFRRPFFAAAVLFLVFCLGAVSAPAEEQQPVVTAIEIRGLQNIEEAAARRRVSQQVGLPLSPEKITEDIKNLYATGYFEDVRVEAEVFEGGLKLIYIVEEKPRITRVEFVGNDEVETSKLREQVTVTTGSIADVVLINENAARLRGFYEEEGYGLAEVVPILNTRGPGTTLSYLIKEGPKVKIAELKFEGNKALSDRELKKAVKSSERGVFSFITKSGIYKKAEVRTDAERIKDAYFNRGYIQAAVSEPQVEFVDGREKAVVRYLISEGEQYKVSGIDFEGNEVFTAEKLRETARLETGKPVSRSRIRQDVVAITELYSNKGYATAGVTPDILPDPASKTAKVVYRIFEGDIYHIGRIEIAGNVKTRDHVIRREVLLDEGETFDAGKLKKSYQRINNLNFFESVALYPQPRPEKKEVDIKIDVEERPTGFLSVGGGYSSVDKLIGMIDLTQGNLGGRGQYLKLKAELGGRSTLYEISYRDPWFMGRPVSFSSTVYRQEREYLVYDRKATGLELGLGKRLSEDWRVSATYKLEQAEIFNISDTASTVIREQEGTNITSSVTPSVTRDTRDNYLDPHEGSRNSVYVTFAGLGGDTRFIKGLVDSHWFFPLGSTTFSVRGRVGYGTGIFGEPLPLYERFYVGGIYTIRGLGYGEGGLLDANGEPIGGEKEVLLNLEYIFPVVESLKLKGVVFFDSGQAFDDSPDDIRYTTGAGIRWISPIGPVRIEWGYNLDRKPGEDTSRWEFAFGSFF